MRTRQAAVVRDATIGNSTIWQSRPIFFLGSAKLHSISRRDRRLKLKENLHFAVVGSIDEGINDLTVSRR
jgi:hypothetical protein